MLSRAESTPGSATNSQNSAARPKVCATPAATRPSDAHGNAVEAVAVSPDGKTAVVADRAGKLLLFDPATGRPRQTLEGPRGPV